MAELKEHKQQQNTQDQQRQNEQPEGTQAQIQTREGTGMSRTPQNQASSRMLTPFEEMDRFMDRVFEGMLPRSWMRPFSLGLERPSLAELAQPFDMRVPKVDVINRDDDIVLKAEVPGIEKDDLHVSVTENTVTIRGETRHEEKSGEGDYFRQEISRGSFSRTLALPSDVDGSKAKANFRNGLLELTLPKIEKSRRHSVNIE